MAAFDEHLRTMLAQS